MKDENTEETIVEETSMHILDKLRDGKNEIQRHQMQALLNDILTEEIEKFREEVRETLYGFDSKVGVRAVIDYVIERYMISFDDLQSKSRKRHLVEPRQVVHWMLRNHVCYNRLSLSAVGELIGGRDHATVLHSCKAINNWVATDSTFRERLMVMCNELGARTKWIPEKKQLMVTGYLKIKTNETLPTEKTEQEDFATA